MQGSLRERKKRQTHETLYGAARDLFAAQGFTATTLQQIAEVAGVSIPTIRNYFGDKDGFLVTQLRRNIWRVFEDEAGFVVQMLRRSELSEWTASAQGASQALDVVASGHVAAQDHAANLMRVVSEHPEGAALLASLQEAIQGAIEAGQKEGVSRADVPADRLARSAGSIIVGSFVHWIQTPELTAGASGMSALAFVRDLTVGDRLPGLRPEDRAFAEEIEAIRPVLDEPRQAPKDGTLKRRIYDEAVRRFQDVGVDATRIADVAAALSISPLTVHYHFGTKDGLVAELLWELTERARGWRGDLAAPAARPDLAAGPALLERLRELPTLRRDLVAALLRVSFMHGEGKRAVQEWLDLSIFVVADGQRRGVVRTDFGPNLLGRIVFILAVGTLLRWTQTPTLSSEEATAEGIEAVLLILGPRSS